MATEQYSIGYEEGYQAGWNAVMDSLQPAQQNGALIGEGTKAPVQQEPIGVVESALRFTGGFHVKLSRDASMPEVGSPLYTSPPAQRTWVGLTDEDKHEIELRAGITEDDDGYIVSQVFKLTEAKLMEKNK